MVKPVSEQLADLSTRAKRAEDAAAAAKTQAADAVEQRQADIKADAERRRADAKQHAADVHATVASDWNGMTTKVQSDVDGIRAKIDYKKYQHDAKRAGKAAEDADENAMAAIGFALDAIDYAEVAVLDAVLAHEVADNY